MTMMIDVDIQRKTSLIIFYFEILTPMFGMYGDVGDHGRAHLRVAGFLRRTERPRVHE